MAQYPIHSLAQSALNFAPWQICSIEHHLAKITRAQSPRIFATVYSQVLIHTTE